MALFKQKEGSTYRYSITDEFHTEKSLPVGVFSLEFNDLRGEFYLIQQQNFQLPEKLYGDFSIVERWKKAWGNTRKNMGILLTGIKGSGKTITAQKFCIEMNMPVILINKNYSDRVHILQSFLGSTELNNSIIFIDEYEKHYSNKDSDRMLAIFDGVLHSRLVFLLTVNTTDRLSEYMVNRLNRIRYKRDYQSLNESVINEVAKDLLKNQNHLDSLHVVFEKIGICTFDLLTEIIREMNIFNEDAVSVAEHMCLEQESLSYNVHEFFDKSLKFHSELGFSQSELPNTSTEVCIISRDVYDMSREQLIQYALLPSCPAEYSFEKLSDIAKSWIGSTPIPEELRDYYLSFRSWVVNSLDTLVIPVGTSKVNLGDGVYMYELSDNHRVFYVRSRTKGSMWKKFVSDRNLIVERYSEYLRNQIKTHGRQSI